MHCIHNVTGSDCQLACRAWPQVIQAGENQFTGTLPASLGNQTGLQYLDLGNNNLTGPLPNSMGDLANLINLNIGNTSI